MSDATVHPPTHATVHPMGPLRPSLGVNVDHVATLRQARYRQGPGGSSGYGEPDLVLAAHHAELGGAECITVHLREDRRHATDRDVEVLSRTIRVKFNLEMAGTDEMIALASRLKPHQATLVPEGRMEVTTEGGLDIFHALPKWKDVVSRLKDAGVVCSAFIDAEPRQIEASHQAGFSACEIHTGPYAHTWASFGGDFLHGPVAMEFERLAAAGRMVRQLNMRFNAGHALNYANVARVASLPGIDELHIGHSIIARAVYVGLERAVRDMLQEIRGPH